MMAPTAGTPTTARARRAIGLAGLVLLLSPALAARAQAQFTGVEISPAKFENDLSSRSFSATLLVANHEGAPRRVTMSVTGLGHNLDGDPQFLESSPATEAISLDATQFVLDPGARREIHLHGEIPADAVSLYAGAVGEFGPVDAPQGSSVAVRSRVATLFLMRGPKPWDESVAVVDVGIIPGDPGRPATVYAALRNTGNVHVSPTGAVQIFKDGKLLDTVKLTGATVIPGFARRLTGSWMPPAGLNGDVTLEAHIQNPGAQGRGAADLSESVGGGSARISRLTAIDDAGPLVELVVTNTGTTGIAPVIVLTAGEGTFERARQLFPQPRMEAGASREVSWRPTLADGTYVIRAQATLGNALLDEAATSLRLGATAGGHPPPRPGASGGRDRLVPWIPLPRFAQLPLLALALAGLWLLVGARRRRKDEKRATQMRPATVVPEPQAAEASVPPEPQPESIPRPPRRRPARSAVRVPAKGRSEARSRTTRTAPSKGRPAHKRARSSRSRAR
jgi:hypothetical protein